jgi:hypothetical protein
MRRRCFAFRWTITRFRFAQLVSAVIGVALVPAVMSGQSQTRKTTTSGKSFAIARTPWGHPDLEGTWTAATLTPLERPDSARGRLELTKEEAEAIARTERERNEGDAQPSDPNRSAPAAGGNVGGYNQFFFDRGSSATKIDGKYRSSIIVDPPDGKIPSMTPAGQARDATLGGRAARPDVVERARAGGGPGQSEPEALFENPEQRPLAEQCILGFGWTSGTPMLPNYNYNNGKQIVQTPDTIMIFAEMVHDARIVRLNGQHPAPQIRKWTGDSIGHWEGDTLVVETTNFTDKTRFQGSSENLKVTERFHRVDANTIVYRFTVEDPSTWAHPWAGEYTWDKTDEPLYEYACHEANYALGNILRGARLRDKEKAAQTDGSKGR